MVFTFQYGEIKSSGRTPPHPWRSHLHSSMERLKVINNIPSNKIEENLHSSMERLKVMFYDIFSSLCKNLHSSMERLKGLTLLPCCATLAIFTFQYGEIKRTRLWRALTRRLRFTFQYGEIKSQVNRFRALLCRNLHSSMERLKVHLIQTSRRLSAIYIPVWRD